MNNSSNAMRGKNPCNTPEFWAVWAGILREKYPFQAERYDKIEQEALKEIEHKSKQDLINHSIQQ